MPYIQRNAQGHIVALTAQGGASAELLPVEHPDVLKFLSTQPEDGADTTRVDLLLSDLKLIRAIEDIIDLLIAKNIIIFSELPPALQGKILAKRGQREKLFGGTAGLLSPDEGIL